MPAMPAKASKTPPALALTLTLTLPALAAAQGLFTDPVALSEPLLTTAPARVGATSEHWTPAAYDAHGHAITPRPGNPDRFVHYDPADPEGTYTLFNPSFSTQRPPNVVRSLGGWVMSFDAEGMWFTGIDDERAELRLIVDGDLDGATVYEYPLAEHPDWAALYAALGEESVTPEPAPGTLCFRGRRTLRCAELATGALPVVLEATALRDAIGPLPHLEARWTANYEAPFFPDGLPGPLPPDAYDWTIDDALALTDGRWFVLASLAIAGGGEPLTARALFEVSPAGAVSVRYGPLRTDDGALDPLGGSDRLLYLPEHDAVAVHTRRARFGWVAIRGAGGHIIHEEQVGDSLPHGWQGHGLVLFPLDEPGHGRLDLTDAVIRRLECAEGGTALGCRLWEPRLLLDRGELRVLVTHVPVENDFTRNFTTIHALAYDPAALDLDGDGLTAAEEAAAGTSAYLADTDGGGTDDQDELRRAGTDPADPGDDPAAAQRAATLVSSPLVRLRVPYDALDVGPGMITWDADGPLCERGACRGPDGAVVRRYDDLPGRDLRFPPIRAVDASHLLVRTTEGFARLFFADGHREPWLTLDALREAFPRAPGAPPLIVDAVTLVPVDARHTWAVNETEPARVVLFDGDTPRVVFDAEDNRCAAGLGPCDPGPRPSAPDLDHSVPGALPGGGLPYPDVPVHDLEGDRLVFVGYEPRTDELQIGLYGTWQTWLVALRADAPPRVLATDRELTPGAGAGPPYVDEKTGRPRLPQGAHVLDDTLRLTVAGLRDPLGAPIAGAVERFSPYGPLMTAWGDTTVYRVYTGGAADGVYELVRYDAALEPDDLVLATWGELHPAGHPPPDDCPTALRVFHGKPRGGLVERLTRCDPIPGGGAVTGDALVGGVAGVDVSADGRLCIADRARVVVLLGTATTGGFPTVPLYDIPLPGALDCAWHDGALYALTDAAAIHRFDPADPAGFLPHATLTPPDGLPPEGFLRLPDGSPAVRFAAPGPEAPRRRALTLDGAPVDPEALAAAADLPEPAAAWDHLRSDGVAIRRDGPTLIARDTYAAAEAPYAWESLDPPGSAVLEAAFAIVPGGEGRDPWTGQRRARPTPDAAPPPPAPPAAATGDDGCAATPAAPAPPLGLALLALLALRRRRVTLARGSCDRRHRAARPTAETDRRGDPAR
ncbi:MAG: MYXO-CTERM sorting domain-containing protein [bacterium]